MKSHMQMPKCVLKQFIIKEGPLKNQFYCFDFDVTAFRIATPDGINSSENYYHNQLETELSAKIESPLGRLIKFVKSDKFQKGSFLLHAWINETIFNYIYSLIARSPQTLRIVKKQSIFSDFFSEQDLHTLTVVTAMDIAKDEKLFTNFTPTFFINNSKEPFILPLCGAYAVEISGGEKWIQIPLTEKVAIRLLDNRFLDQYVNDGKLARFSTSNHEIIQQLNQMAFLEQRKKGGCIISSSKEALENAKKCRVTNN